MVCSSPAVFGSAIVFDLPAGGFRAGYLPYRVSGTPPRFYPISRESPERPGHHRGRGVLSTPGRQDAEPLVRRDEPEPAQLELRGPADEAITRPTRQCRRCEANQRDPLAGGIDSYVAHRLADHPVTQPVVLIQLRIEATSVTSQHRGDPKARQPRISHPLHVASAHRCAPISSQHRRSAACGVDYEKAVTVP